MNTVPGATAAAETHPLPIGINFDGVLDHDGLPDPSVDERFARVTASGAFDFMEKNVKRGEDFGPVREASERHGVPIGVLGGIFRAGLDEPRAREAMALACALRPRLFNCQLFTHHADGHALSDGEVVDFFLRLSDWGSAAGVLPSFEVHVDMWAETLRRVETVADRLIALGVSPRFTLDLAHILYKVGNAEELAIGDNAGAVADGTLVLDPDAPEAVYKRWWRAGWVVHAHARSVALNGPVNTWLKRPDGRPGRAIQYPFIEPLPGSFHSAWRAEAIAPWRRATVELLAWSAADAQSPLQQFACEFLPYADCGGGARYSVWDNNLACAAWLREQWRALAATPPH